MKDLPIETDAYYIFDRGYNNFKELYRIHEQNLSLLSDPRQICSTGVSSGNVGLPREY